MRQKGASHGSLSCTAAKQDSRRPVSALGVEALSRFVLKNKFPDGAALVADSSGVTRVQKA